MTGIGTAMAGFAGLTVKFESENWEFVLRRDDFAPDPAFGALHLAKVRPQDVARFLPNWEALAWVRVPDNLLSRAECWARDWPYQVSIRARAGSRLEHRDVVDAFNRYMAAATT